MRLLFASDLHGRERRYKALFDEIARESPDLVCLGGDLLPRLHAAEFIDKVLRPGFAGTRSRVFLIPGNDDPRVHEAAFMRGEEDGLWTWLVGRTVDLGPHRLYGYAYVPPTPFQLKDWERYDVSHYVDPGCVSPEEGARSVEVDEMDVRYGTIARDLERFADDEDLHDAIFLFHTPPYDTALDRAALDGKTFEHVPLDVHVGSIAVRRFIEARQPLLTLHGHVHESARLTGRWRDRIGRTILLGAAHDGPELALVRVDTEAPASAERLLL